MFFPPTKVLYVDLDKKDYKIEDRKDLFEKYVGGLGVAVALFEEECLRGVDPYAPENPIVFAIGPLSGHFPVATKTVAVFKSPVTKGYGESYAGGRSAFSIAMAGYGAMVVKGASDKPVYIAVHNYKVQIKDATTLWGMRSTYAVGRVLAEVEPGKGRRTIFRIGPAGERLVCFANVMVEVYRHFGRLGLGAVFGSKKLKAMVISGTNQYPITRRSDYIKAYNDIFNEVVKTGKMRKYHDLGTAVNVRPLNEIKALPTRNLTASRFEHADDISGEVFAETYLIRKISCIPCPIGCIHIASLRIPFDVGYDYESLYVPYDYEPIFALGSMIGTSTPAGLLKLIERVDRHGLDAMQAGVLLAWITEAYQKGLISESDLNGVKPEWGNVENYLTIVDHMVYSDNEFYATLRKGFRELVEKYGGEDFALHYNGNAMPGYHCGPATVVGYTIGLRHSHLDNAGYSLDQKTLKSPLSPEEQVEKLVKEEQWRCLLNSLVICLFARGVYTEENVLKALKAVGLDLTQEDLWRIAKEIYGKRLEIKIREEGFNPLKLHIAKRVFETETSHGMLSKEQIEKMLKHYVEVVEKEYGVKLPNER